MHVINITDRLGINLLSTALATTFAIICYFALVKGGGGDPSDACPSLRPNYFILMQIL